jgi:hypothetical protein
MTNPSHFLLDIVYGDLEPLEDKEEGKDVVIFYDEELIPRLYYYIGSRNLVVRFKDKREFKEFIPYEDKKLTESYDSWLYKKYSGKCRLKGIKLLTLV